MSVTETPRRRPLWGAAADLLVGRLRSSSDPAGAPALAPDSDWGALVVESLPDPALVVVGTSRDEPTGWRYVLANRAARDVLRIARPEGPLVTVLRDPMVLDSICRSLFDGAAEEVAYAIPGVQERVWRIISRALGEGTVAEERVVLVLLRDETDLRRSERTRADFLANASHELRTPLASLIGFIETLRGHARDDAVARERFLGIMQAQAERMSRLIDDLMSLSRIEFNEHIPPSGEADLALVARDVLDAVALLAEERGVTLQASAPAPGDALVSGDRDQVVQVVQNLVDNALKYSAPGSVVRVEVLADVASPEQQADRDEARPRFWILSPEHAPQQRYVSLRVSDGGAGLAREHLPRLAQRFYRVEGQKSSEQAGTGLGLAIVKHIVNRHSGAFLVDSAPGEGAAFTVFLPRRSQRGL
jgi:two-component system phosphate regulon sensor histidine kinase PhoR